MTESSFVMWDFLRAYNHMAHLFLWKTLQIMGFSSYILQHVGIGINGRGSSIIHANGFFSRVVELDRGFSRNVS